MRRAPAPGPTDSGASEIYEASRERPPDLAARVGKTTPPPRRLPPTRRWLKLGLIAVGLAFFWAGVSAYRRHQDQRIIAISIARARHLVRSDTWRGYREAADLLGLRAAAIDPTGAGALRSFALAMLSLDYRDDAAGSIARSSPSPGGGTPSPDARFAAAALALRDARIGTAVEQLSEVGGASIAGVLRARAALLAGRPEAAAREVAGALAVDPRLPAALALRGDLLRRAGRAAEAREAYVAALRESGAALDAGSGSPGNPLTSPPQARAIFGLAKLALSRDIPAPEATAALGGLLADDGTPVAERARAAMYLAALQARLGDRSGASTTLGKAAVDAELRAWMEKTVKRLEVARGRYRVPEETPPALASASDDDPYLPPPPSAKVEAPPKHPKAMVKSKTVAKGKKRQKKGAPRPRSRTARG
jgi:tetratricopeptide (TPR) repeat protein